MDKPILAEARFTLARCLWRTGDRAAARRLAATARTGVVEAGGRPRELLREVEEWQAAH